MDDGQRSPGRRDAPVDRAPVDRAPIVEKPIVQAPLAEGVDYTVDASGLLVLTSAYLRRRGTCCGNKCRNCPFAWRDVPAWRRVAGERQPPFDG